jgi:hypothetical protein
VSSEWVSKVIEDLRQQWVADGHAASFQAINSGQCRDFAELVVDTIREQAGEGDLPEIACSEICDFFLTDTETGFPTTTAARSIATRWPRLCRTCHRQPA